MCLQGVGVELGDAAGRAGRVAQGAGHLALPGTHLQLPGHHGTDAGGGSALRHGRQELEGHHEAVRRRQTRAHGAPDRQDPRETQEI